MTMQSRVKVTFFPNEIIIFLKYKTLNNIQYDLVKMIALYNVCVIHVWPLLQISGCTVFAVQASI